MWHTDKSESEPVILLHGHVILLHGHVILLQGHVILHVSLLLICSTYKLRSNGRLACCKL